MVLYLFWSEALCMIMLVFGGTISFSAVAAGEARFFWLFSFPFWTTTAGEMDAGSACTTTALISSFLVIEFEDDSSVKMEEGGAAAALKFFLKSRIRPALRFSTAKSKGISPCWNNNIHRSVIVTLQVTTMSGELMVCYVPNKLQEKFENSF